MMPVAVLLICNLQYFDMLSSCLNLDILFCREQLDFDDSHWPQATVVLGKNSVSPWGVRPGISLEAEWIWTDGYTQGTAGYDRSVYCRYAAKPGECYISYN